MAIVVLKAGEKGRHVGVFVATQARSTAGWRPKVLRKKMVF